MSFQIIGTGSYLPQKIVTNYDLEKEIDTSDEWIVQRTGIRQRHFIEEGEWNVNMCVEAASSAISMAGIEVNSIQAIIAGTCTNEMAVPSLACQIQRDLNIKNCISFDVNAACSGFIFALKTAEHYLSEISNNILVIGSETLSRFLDMKDRNSCILFGDGAGAVIINTGDKCRHFKIYSKPDVNHTLNVTGANTKHNNIIIPSHISIKGRDVYSFATREFEKIIHEGLKKCELTPDDVSLFILHQANLRIIQSVSQRLCISMDKFYTNIENSANTSAACIPIALDQANREEKLHPGDIIVIAGVGGGLTSGCAIYKW